MDREDFIRCINTIIQEEGYQQKRQRTVVSSVRDQRRCINRIAKALGVEKMTEEEVEKCSFG